MNNIFFQKIKIWSYKPIGVYKLYKRIKCSTAYCDGPKIFLLNIPSHGNMGDHLIAVAEYDFLHDYAPHYCIVKVTSADLFFSPRIALSRISRDDIICITGGGFMGSMYTEEKRILKIIEQFPHNKIIFFPQTIYYEPTIKGNRLKKHASLVYNSHSQLYIMARDESTYNLLIHDLFRFYPEHVKLMPDIALYKSSCITSKRSGVLFCIRNDKEKSVNSVTLIEELKRSIKDEIKYTDTYVPYAVSLSIEKEEVQKKIEEFRNAKLIVTDRLHGMIYAVITGTPVIAVDNLNGKIGQVYKLWLKDIPYVRFITEKSNIQAVVGSLLEIKRTTYNHKIFLPFFRNLSAIFDEKN